MRRGDIPTRVLVRYLQGEMTRSETEETARRIEDSRSSRERLDQIRAMMGALEKAPSWIGSVDLVERVRTARSSSAAPRPARSPRRTWWVSAAAATAAVAAVVVAVGLSRSDRDAGGGPERAGAGAVPGAVRAKGGGAAPGEPDRWVGISLFQPPAPPDRGARLVQDQVPRGDLLVSYTNLGPRPFEYLMVFAIDAAGQVRWFYPAYEEAGTNPAAVPIERGAADRMLPESSGSRLRSRAPGRVRTVSPPPADRARRRARPRRAARAGPAPAVSGLRPALHLEGRAMTPAGRGVARTRTLSAGAALVAAALAVTAASRAAAAAPAVRRFALVIGENHSDQRDVLNLRYADDDAIAMHQLLREAGVESVLLVRPDADTRAQSPGLEPGGPPRWSELINHLRRLEADIRAANAAGERTSLLIFYSGHGGVAHGEGYIQLEDTRLTRTLLRRAILDRTAAGQVNVIVNACRSYYLAFDKGPGGRRRRAEPGALAEGARPRVGYVLSTSSDRDSHEWEMFQGGIFSHEVESALRGAADANRDGLVTYAELGAFLTVANRGIPNARFRPDFLVRPAAALSDVILGWPARAEALLLDEPDQGHLYVEDAVGARVADVHAARGQLLALHLPERRPLFVRRQGGGREVVIRGRHEVTRLSDLDSRPVMVASKGAIHIAFGMLFSAPFGEADVAVYRAEVARSGPREGAAGAAVPIDVDVDAGARAPGPARGRTAAGIAALTAGAIGLGLGGWAIERSIAAQGADQQHRVEINHTITRLRTASALSLGGAAIAGAIWLWLGHRDGPPATAGVGLSLAPGPDRSARIGLTWTGDW